MKKILITGSKGFIGKNLIAHLQINKIFQLFQYDLDVSEKKLEEWLHDADFIFHLAGINRPKDEQEYKAGNTDFTVYLINRLMEAGKKTPIVFSSSIQATLENPYGISKRNAEEVLFKYRETGAPVYIYRLSNVFGKWSRPNYNSVVATFCHNIAHELPIQVNNPDLLLTLVYIDDIVAEFIDVLKKGKATVRDYYQIPISHQITLQAMADRLYAIHNNRETLVVPDLANSLTKKLHATYLSYLPEDRFSYPLKLNSDKRGNLFELIKSPHFGQIFVSTTKPGIIRGNHYHHTKNEKFVVLKGEAEIKFRHILNDKVITYRVSGDQPQVVDIPTGYTHSIKNIGKEEMITFFWSNEPFNPDNPDTYFDQVEKG